MVSLDCTIISMPCNWLMPSGFHKPFHNQLRKASFALFMKALVERAIAFAYRPTDEDCIPLAHSNRCCCRMVLPLPSTKPGRSVFGRFKTISPAAIECHMLMSLLEQSPVCMQVSADTASERQFRLSPSGSITALLLADAGYIDMAYFAKLNGRAVSIWSGVVRA